MLDALPSPAPEANGRQRPSQPRQKAKPPAHPLVGLTGVMGSGKSTAAKALRRNLAFEIVPLAAPLKEMLAALGVPAQHLYGSPRDKAAPLALLGGKSARYAMQTLGTEWGRTFLGPEFWIQAWVVKARAMRVAVVADDVRFQNEAEAIRALGGIVIRIERPGLDTDEALLAHASEQRLDADVTIVNDGDRARLTRRLNAALRAHGIIGARAA